MKRLASAKSSSVTRVPLASASNPRGPIAAELCRRRMASAWKKRRILATGEPYQVQSASSPPPASDPLLGSLVFLILIAAIVVWATSPARWQTFKKMALAFVATLVLAVVLGLAIGVYYSSPALTGMVAELGGYAAIFSAFIMGRQHVSTLKKQMKVDATTSREIDDGREPAHVSIPRAIGRTLSRLLNRRDA